MKCREIRAYLKPNVHFKKLLLFIFHTKVQRKLQKSLSFAAFVAFAFAFIFF